MCSQVNEEKLQNDTKLIISHTFSQYSRDMIFVHFL